MRCGRWFQTGRPALALVAVSLLSLVLSACSGVGSQPAAENKPKYPTRPVDLIVPFDPGSSGDLSARVVATYASKVIGQSVNVVNKPGASGITGSLEALNAKPDGYTLLMMSGTTSSIMAATRTDMPFKLEDRAYIARVFAEDWFFFANNKTGWNTLKDAIDAAKSKPAEFIWSAAAFGSQPMFAQLDLFEAAGVDVSKTKMVVFDKGNSPALQALAEGSTLFGAGTAGDVSKMVATGRVKVLAVTAPKRLSEFTDVPTTTDAGFAGADRIGWYGLAGPKGTPADVAKFWADLMQKASQDKSALDEANKAKKTFRVQGSEEFRKFVLGEYEEVLPLATRMGIRK